MEESINPTINIGPVTFDLTMLAIDLVDCGSYFWLYLLGESQYDLETQRKAKMYLSISMTLLLDLQNLTLVPTT